jgi:hypothetical protein
MHQFTYFLFCWWISNVWKWLIIFLKFYTYRISGEYRSICVDLFEAFNFFYEPSANFLFLCETSVMLYWYIWCIYDLLHIPWSFLTNSESMECNVYIYVCILLCRKGFYLVTIMYTVSHILFFFSNMYVGNWRGILEKAMSQESKFCRKHKKLKWKWTNENRPFQ